jgi:hypothetical protein
MGQSFRIGEIIYRDELDIGIVQGRTNDIPANAAESVDSNFDGHKTTG